MRRVIYPEQDYENMDTRTLDRALFAVGAAVLLILIIFTIGMLGGTSPA